MLAELTLGILGLAILIVLIIEGCMISDMRAELEQILSEYERQALNWEEAPYEPGHPRHTLVFDVSVRDKAKS